jgi:hypothetical protein
MLFYLEVSILGASVVLAFRAASFIAFEHDFVRRVSNAYGMRERMGTLREQALELFLKAQVQVAIWVAINILLVPLAVVALLFGPLGALLLGIYFLHQAGKYGKHAMAQHTAEESMIFGLDISGRRFSLADLLIGVLFLGGCWSALNAWTTEPPHIRVAAGIHLFFVCLLTMFLVADISRFMKISLWQRVLLFASQGILATFFPVLVIFAWQSWRRGIWRACYVAAKWDLSDFQEDTETQAPNENPPPEPSRLDQPGPSPKSA